MPLTEQIKPVSYLEENVTKIIKAMVEGKEPLVIEEEGQAKVVILNAADYEKMQDTLAMLKLIALADREIDEGDYMPIDEAFADLYNKIENNAL